MKDKIPAIYMSAEPAPARHGQPTAGHPAPVDEHVLDFQSIDSVTEAAMLPLLDPAFDVAMVIAGIAAATGGSPTIGVVLSGTLGPHAITLQYTVDRTGINCTGVIGSHTVREGMGSGEETRLLGKIGASKENLKMVTQSDGTLCASGRVGEVQADLKYQGQNERDLKVSGLLDETPYSATGHFVAPADGAIASFEVTGALGEEAIKKSYTVTADAKAKTLTIEGGGHVGEHAQSLKIVIMLDDPNVGEFTLERFRSR